MSQLALLSCAWLIYWLYRKDRQLRKLPSAALWVPALWLAILGSRSPSQWLYALDIGRFPQDGGNTVDQVFYGGLIAAAVVILVGRRFKWGSFVVSNKALVLIYAYWVASCFWSLDTATAFKPLVKDFGCVLIGLVFLTERKPWTAMRIVVLRVAYVLVPLSIVLIKYFPSVGRVSNRAGSDMYAGVAMTKNTMGVIVLLLALFIVAELVFFSEPGSGARKVDRWIRYGMLFLCLEVLFLVNSKTSLLCLILGCIGLWASKRLANFHSAGRVLAFGLIGGSFLWVCDQVFDLSLIVIQALGRDPTLTGRTEIWAGVLATDTNFIFGEGYNSFWDTPMGAIVMAPFPGGLYTAHNGYLEVFLNGGTVGVVFLAVLLITWLWRTITLAREGTVLGRLAFVICLIGMIYNYSESNFFRMEPLWFTQLLLTTVPGRLKRAFAEDEREEASVETGPPAQMNGWQGRDLHRPRWVRS